MYLSRQVEGGAVHYTHEGNSLCCHIANVIL